MPTKAGFVAIIGEPNVGKSTLLNAMLGTKLSIVSPKPQTTRRSILGIVTEGTEEDGVQIIFFDTPGILSKASYKLHHSMIDFVKSSVEGADVLLVVADVQKLIPHSHSAASSHTLTPQDHVAPNPLQTLTERLHMSFEAINKPIIIALNKMDTLQNKNYALPVMEKLSSLPFVRHIAAISALHNAYVRELLDTLKEYMPEHEFYYDAEMLSTQPQRFFVGEIIRETIFTRYRQEIPYSTEVSITQFKERQHGKWYIAADIIVERDTQKYIIIGKGGSTLRETGRLARKAIEQYLGCEVFLELFVKVRADWRNNPIHLRSFGYH
ncbi:MAG: GTPase Era [Bacteroidota bacterium]|nr:GTPase Era [Candidatus Kapabacteria bacterium]MDW8219918.1 GTPase Era [Bacteroidota bacterium]